MALSWRKPRISFAKALVVKSPEASSTGRPTHRDKAPQNSLSPRPPPHPRPGLPSTTPSLPSKKTWQGFPLRLHPLCLLRLASSITGWRQRCSSDELASDKSRTKPSHCDALASYVSRSKVVTVGGGGGGCLKAGQAWWPDPGPPGDPYRPLPGLPGHTHTHSFEHPRLRVE